MPVQVDVFTGMPNGQYAIAAITSQTASDLLYFFNSIETGGLPVGPPEQKGFDSTLLEQLIQGDLAEAPRLTFEADGFICELNVLLAALEAPDAMVTVRYAVRNRGTWSLGPR